LQTEDPEALTNTQAKMSVYTAGDHATTERQLEYVSDALVSQVSH
jgi:hypothetical protein